MSIFITKEEKVFCWKLWALAAILMFLVGYFVLPESNFIARLILAGIGSGALTYVLAIFRLQPEEFEKPSRLANAALMMLFGSGVGVGLSTLALFTWEGILSFAFLAVGAAVLGAIVFFMLHMALLLRVRKLKSRKTGGRGPGWGM